MLEAASVLVMDKGTFSKARAVREGFRVINPTQIKRILESYQADEYVVFFLIWSFLFR